MMKPGEHKILIVEDEVLTYMFLKVTLNKEGFIICLNANDKDTALQIFDKEKPEMVLMDIRLHDNFEGIEIAKIIKEKQPETQLIFITGYDDDHTRNLTMSLNPLAYLTKPLNTKELITLIKDYFKSLH